LNSPGLRIVLERTNYAVQRFIDDSAESKQNFELNISKIIDANLRKFNDSVSGSHSISILDNILKAGIVHVFERRDDAKKRILELLPTAKRHVQLMGISLRRFFHHGSEINDCLRQMSKNLAKWEALVIDPECEHALLRSLREHESYYKNVLALDELSYSQMNKDELFKTYGEAYRNAQLYTDVVQMCLFLSVDYRF